MDSIIDRVGPCLLGHQTDRGGPAPDHYGALVRSIVGQQVSVAAARSMLARLHDRFGGRTPTPGQILADDPEELRAAAGLSRSKAAFLRDLADGGRLRRRWCSRSLTSSPTRTSPSGSYRCAASGSGRSTCS